MTLHEFDPKTVDRLKHALAGGFIAHGNGRIYLDVTVERGRVTLAINTALPELGTALEWAQAWYDLTNATAHSVDGSGPAGPAPWHFTTEQTAQVECTFDTLDLATAEARDAMGRQLTAHLEGREPEWSFQAARDNLLRAKAEIELLLEIVTLSEEKFCEASRLDRHDGPAAGSDPDIDAGGAPRLAGAGGDEHRHLPSDFGDVAAGGTPQPAAPDAAEDDWVQGGE